MAIARQRVDKHILTKQTLGTIEDVLLGNGAVNRLWQKCRLFSVGSVQSGYKRGEFRSWQFSSEVVEDLERELKDYIGVQRS
jgi:hypothetical protein